MVLQLRRSPADELSAAFARAVTAGVPAAPRLVGVEHEFRVLADGRPVDFRRLIHELPIPGRRLDPADPNAYRGAWGGSITSDGREAELAIPPQAIEPGFAGRAASAARRGRSELVGALPLGLRLEGYSTHVSVSMPDRVVEAAARRFASTFAPALLLLLDGPTSPGLLVRPRPGRLELGGEFVDGERLEAAIIFATGAALATARAVGSRVPWAERLRHSRRLPPAVDVQIEPAFDRYGWLVGGVAGADLHADGRWARLRLAEAGRGRPARTITAQEHLEQAWAVARRALVGLAGPAGLTLVDRFVRGDRPLGVELEQAAAIAAADAGTRTSDANEVPMGGPFGAVVGLRRRPGLVIEPSIVGWEFAVLRITEDLATVTGRTAFACLPRSVLGPGLEALDRGHLDAILRAYLNLNADIRVLAGAPQTRRPGLYRAVASGGRLLARELGPDLPGADRPGKRQRRDPRDSQPQPSNPAPTPPGLPAGARPAATAAATAAAITIFGLPAAAAAAVATVATVAVVGGAIILGGGGSPAPSAAPSATVAGPVASPTTGSSPSDGAIAVADAITFGSGSTTMTIATTAGDSGGVVLPLEVGQILPDGSIRVTWGDGVYDPTSGASGATEWYTMRGTAYADGTYIQLLGGIDFGADLESGEQAASGSSGATCEIEFSRTPTLGIVGTYVCDEDDPALGRYQVSGTYWAEPGGTGPEPSDGGFVPEYTGGTASVRLTGAGEGSLELIFANELESGPADGETFPEIVWSDADALNTFGITTLTPHATGTLSTANGTLGAGWFFDAVLIDGFEDWFPGGIGLGRDPGGPGLGCEAVITSLPDGGITGTLSCPNVNDPSLPIGLEAEFRADYSDTGLGTGGGVIVVP